MVNSGKFDGPYGRYYKALEIIEHPELSESSDPWVSKLVEILQLYNKYCTIDNGLLLMQKEYPLYYNLVSTFKEDKPGSDKEILEACLLGSANYKEIADTINIERLDSIFIGTYQELFYHINDFRGNDIMFIKHIILPIMNADSNKIATGHIWKLLASCGGLKLLMEKGFGAKAIKPEDIEYLLQLSSWRSCTLLMQYSAKGKDMWGENCDNSALIEKLTELDSMRSGSRRYDGLSAISGISKNAFSNMLSAGIKLISMPKDMSEDILRLDGTFHPELLDNTAE